VRRPPRMVIISDRPGLTGPGRCGRPLPVTDGHLWPDGTGRAPSVLNQRTGPDHLHSAGRQIIQGCPSWSFMSDGEPDGRSAGRTMLTVRRVRVRNLGRRRINGRLYCSSARRIHRVPDSVRRTVTSFIAWRPPWTREDRTEAARRPGPGGPAGAATGRGMPVIWIDRLRAGADKNKTAGVWSLLLKKQLTTRETCHSASPPPISLQPSVASRGRRGRRIEAYRNGAGEWHWLNAWMTRTRG